MKIRLNKSNPKTVDYDDLTLGRLYTVIGVEADDYRIMSDGQRPHLYPVELFEVVDALEPESWVTEYGDEGERYAYAPPLGLPGFFEDYFDNDPKATTALNAYLLASDLTS